MKFWMGTTDNRWFEFLSARRLDEVNFWQPSPRSAFGDVPYGMPFLFKLKRPFNHVAGGGYFVARSALPIELAWEIFGEKNGSASIGELRELIGPLRDADSPIAHITCQVIANAVYFDQNEWLSDPPGWSGNIVRGKMYDSLEPDGAAIWAHVQPLLEGRRSAVTHEDPAVTPAVRDPGARYGDPVMFQPRLGQASFRVAVTEAYRRRCAVTGESTLLALEAAHIVPYAEEGSHDVCNGMLLRADFHRLFDAGLVAVTPDLKVRISPRIREAWFNGKAYYRMDAQPLSVTPEQPQFRPDPDRLQWHMRNRFQA